MRPHWASQGFLFYQLLSRSLFMGVIYSAVLLLIVFSFSVSANTAEFIEENQAELEVIASVNDVQQGQLIFQTDKKLLLAPLMETKVDMNITGMISRVTLQQQFTNTTNNWQEGIYVFPLPENAAVDHLKMFIGERIIEGKIKPRKKAKQIYQEAKSSGKKASLIEQERPNIFTTSVANIAPGETIRIEIQYQHNVIYDSGEFHLRFPMVVAPRYIPGKQIVSGFTGSGWASNTEAVNDAERITPPVPKNDELLENPVHISIRLSPGFELAQVHSPYHDIDIHQEQSDYLVRLSSGKTAANRDFELVWRPQLTETINGALFTERYADEDYALLMLVPQIKSDNATTQAHHNRELVFVIDTSGSMAGESIRQAQSALLTAIARLQPADTFNIVEFNSNTQSLFPKPKIANNKNINRAKRFIKGLNAEGGTEMLPAMKLALSQSGAEHGLSQIVFMTDGSIGNEDALFKLIQNQLNNSRLFAVGIGSAPNSHFMSRAARFGRGTFTYIGDTSEVDDKISSLFHKLEDTVLTDIQIAWPEQENNSVIETWPKIIPDVYAGEPMLIAMKADSIPESLVVSGHTAHAPWNFRIDLVGGQQHRGIAKLWARRKIAALMDQRLFEQEPELIEQQITDVGMKYHLVSRFTSLVAVDVTPTRPSGATLDSKAVPSKLPHGWQHDKVFGPMPQTATPAVLHFMIGCCLLLVSVFGRRLTRNVY